MIWGWRAHADADWTPPDPRGRRHDLVDVEVAEARRRERIWLIWLHVALLAAILAAWAAEAVWGAGSPAMVLGSGFRKYCAATAGAVVWEWWLVAPVLTPGLLFAFRKEVLAGAAFAAVLVVAAIGAECACGRGCVWPLDAFL